MSGGGFPLGCETEAIYRWYQSATYIHTYMLLLYIYCYVFAGSRPSVEDFFAPRPRAESIPAVKPWSSGMCMFMCMYVYVLYACASLYTLYMH